MNARKRLLVDEPGVTTAMSELATAAAGWRGRNMAGDRRPRYSPAAVVDDVQAAMLAAGVEVNPTPAQRDLAMMRAVDLLAALGIAPQALSRPGGSR